MEDPGLVEPRGIQRHFERSGDVLGPHCGAQLPGDDVAREVVKDRGQIEPSPADDFEISEVRLPEFVWRRRLILELVGGLHHDEGWAGDQIVSLEDPIDRSLRDKIAFGVGEPYGQFPRAQCGLIQRQLDDALTNVVWNAVPDAIWFGMSVVQGFRPTGLVQIVPAVKGGARNANLFQRPPHWQGGLLDEPDDLKLLGGGVPHAASSPATPAGARNGFGEPRDREPKSTLFRLRPAAETARPVFEPRKRPYFAGYSSETRKRRFVSDCGVGPGGLEPPTRPL